MADYNEISIYFDTNALERRKSKNLVSLSRFEVHPLYYDVEKLIVRLGLASKVQICIPEIVLLEMEEHLMSQFQSIKASMRDKIASYREMFGDLIELNCEFTKIDDTAKYNEYIQSIEKEFLEGAQLSVSIIPYPRDTETIEEIVKQSINSTEPFRSAKNNGKEYSDAGFKDAMIIKTIEQNIKEEHLTIFITHDQDFKDVILRKSFKNFYLCDDKDSIRNVLCEAFNILDEEEFMSRIKSDEYLRGRILTEVGFEETLSCQFIRILIYEQTEKGIQAKILTEIESEQYVFTLLYNVETRELLEASYEKWDRDEYTDEDSK